MILDKEKFQNYHCDQYKYKDDEPGIVTMSLLELKNSVDNMIRNAEINNKKLTEVPVFIEIEREKYCVNRNSTSWGKLGMICSFAINVSGIYSDKLYYVAPDSRPEEGEYWESRGVSDYDVSGFVKSKLAGERLLRMVKYVLETDEPESRLDYRESEPNWIQFKFKPNEFDIELLDKLSKEADGIITLDILKKCKQK